jgi:Cu/Ag efflux protein CusF
MSHLIPWLPIAAAVAVLAVSPSPTLAQQPSVSQSQLTSTTVTIQAIDAATRILTVRLENGEVDSFEVGPQVVRFNELKVGDRIRASYLESVVLELRKPGEASKPPADTLAGGTATTAKPPAAGVARRQTTTVTVLKVDQAAPSLTVQTADGRTVTRKVADKNAIANVKAGDRIDVTYTQALVANVEPAK